MEDIRCSQCGRLLGKKMEIRYGEIKCPRCGAINIFDYRIDLTALDNSANFKLKVNKRA